MKMTPSNFIVISRIVFFLALTGFGAAMAQENPSAIEKISDGDRVILGSVSKVVLATYRAMEEKEAEDVLASHHPKTNLHYTKEQLEKYFAESDVTYSIANIRYIGNDGENYIVIYREKMELRMRGQKEVFDQEDADVVMVLRKDKGEYKIYTFNSLKPGKW